jgi:hypothetical protein
MIIFANDRSKIMLCWYFALPGSRERAVLPLWANPGISFASLIRAWQSVGLGRIGCKKA